MKALRAWICLLLALAAGGCSSFSGHWRAAAKPQAPGVDTVSRWEGRWTSSHHRQPWGGPAGGRLRCILEEGAGGNARAEFHANWLCFSADYTVTLQRQRVGGPGRVKEFAGSQELPAMFGGLYQYRARVGPERFDATYTSTYDAGVFGMTRLLTSPREFH